MWPVAGHEQIVACLERSLNQGTLAHAYLLTGLPHVGKMTLAKALAQALNCEAGAKPCGECPSCLKIARGIHPDVQIVKPWSVEEAPDKKARTEIVVDQIEQLQHSANLPPYEGRCRVFIFEQAELLNIATANRLLKTLEEPLPGIVFLLITAIPEALPETVVSRCQVLAFRPLPTGKIAELLRGRGVDEVRASSLARLAQGAPGWALMAIEDENLVTARQEQMNSLIDLISQDYEERFELAEGLAGRGGQNRAAIQTTFDLWLELWRDLLLISVGAPEAIINSDSGTELSMLAGGFRPGEIRSFIGRLRLARRQLDLNVNPRLLLEVLMLEMPRSARVTNKKN
jgi:DNA polymerase III subunit delta'